MLYLQVVPSRRCCIYFLIACLFRKAISTEITVDTHTIDRSLGLDIQLPVLMCHVRHTGYKVVSWYKDYVLLKNGSTDIFDHILPLSSLLKNNPSFEHPLKLQGYYWCETDHTKPATIFDYLFRIKEIHTFVGTFTSTRDSLGKRQTMTLKEKIKKKKSVYEEEMQNILFAFLPTPSVYVTYIKVLKKGLNIRFFLYARPLIQPRKPVDNELELDQQEMDYIIHYINNETSVVKPELYYEMQDWADFRGIKIESIQLKSTLGCYENVTVSSLDPQLDAAWPYARIGDIVIPDNACSAKNGLTVSRACTGSFNNGATWGNPYGTCKNLPQGVVEQLKNLYDNFGTEDRVHYIQQFETLTKYPSELDVTGLHIAIKILKELSRLPKLEPQEISGMLSVIDKIIEVNQTELDTAKSLIRLTSRVLKVFDNILKSASEEEKEIRISKQHVLLETKHIKTPGGNNRVLGFSVTSQIKEDFSLENGSVEFVLNGTKLPPSNAVAYFVLPPDLISSREFALKFPGQVSMVFFKEWYLFQTPKEVLLKRHYKLIPTPVLYVSLSGGPAWNLTNAVQLYFRDTHGKKIENPVCVYYDPRLEDETGAWSSEGCEYKGLKDGFYHCSCHHLSIFGVILSQRPDIPEKFTLGTSVYVGCGVSILALSFTVLLFVLSKHWRLTVDHCILFCLSLTLLVCLTIIFISEMHFVWTSSCMVLALVFHYTIFSILGWLLVHAVVYRLRFAKKTDVSEIPHFMLKAALSVWGSPIIIVIIIWFIKDYSVPEKNNCWLTVFEVSLTSVIPIVVLMLVALCVNVCATYSLTCRFRKDFLTGDSNYSEPAVKFRVSFTIFLFFVLTWLFGFFALYKKSQDLRVLFSISITITAYYLTLFFTFHEISFWDICSKYLGKGKSDTTTVKYEAKSYKTMEQ